MSSGVRQFSTGANRDVDTGKHDYDGFLSPLVIEAFGAYMNFNRTLADGSRRDSDNWQKGIPQPVYVKSKWRHFMDFWKFTRGLQPKEHVVAAVCGDLFNTMGWLHEYLKQNPGAVSDMLAQMGAEREKRWAQPKTVESPPLVPADKEGVPQVGEEVRVLKVFEGHDRVGETGFVVSVVGGYDSGRYGVAFPLPMKPGHSLGDACPPGCGWYFDPDCLELVRSSAEIARQKAESIDNGGST